MSQSERVRLLPRPEANDTCRPVRVQLPLLVSTALIATAGLGSSQDRHDRIAAADVVTAISWSSVGQGIHRAHQVLGRAGADALLCFEELQNRIAERFDRPGEYVEIRVVEEMPDEGDGPYVFIDICTQDDVNSAAQRFEDLEGGWWLANRHRAQVVTPTLRFV